MEYGVANCVHTPQAICSPEAITDQKRNTLSKLAADDVLLKSNEGSEVTTPPQDGQNDMLQHESVSPCDEIGNQTSFIECAHISCDWGEELSPIAPSRESLSPRKMSSIQIDCLNVQTNASKTPMQGAAGEKENLSTAMHSIEDTKSTGADEITEETKESSEIIINSTAQTDKFTTTHFRNANAKSYVDECVMKTTKTISKSHHGALASLMSNQLPPDSHSLKTDSLISKLDNWGSPDRWKESSASNNCELVNQDITDTRKQLGATSSEFIERIRGAAHSRKKKLARSRDSLVAKEKEQREAIAAYKEALTAEPPSDREPEYVAATPRRTYSDGNMSYQTFKAKPLPDSHWGGGLNGVPKIETKPTTTPFSPLLGSRRTQKSKVRSLREPPLHKPKIIRETVDLSVVKPATKKKYSAAFKARPLPQTTGDLGHGGLSGVPKVPTRPVTVPVSPLLGLRRAQSADIGRKRIETLYSSNSSEREFKRMNKFPTKTKEGEHQLSRCHSIMEARYGIGSRVSKRTSPDIRPRLSPEVGESSPSLLGLNLLTRTPGTENIPPVTPTNGPRQVFTPHSTVRAKTRAEFDAKRAQQTRMKKRDNLETKEKLIKTLTKQLGKERQKLRRNSYFN